MINLIWIITTWFVIKPSPDVPELIVTPILAFSSGPMAMELSLLFAIGIGLGISHLVRSILGQNKI